MSTLKLAVNVAFVAFVAAAATTLWCACASDDDASPSEDGGTDSPFDASLDDAGEDVDGGPRSPVCSDAFCRVTVEGIEDVALDGLWAKNASDVWVVGSLGFAARFDGTKWQRVVTGTKAAILGVTGAEDGTVWGASSGNEFFRLNRERDGGVETSRGGDKSIVTGIFAFGPDVYAVGTTLYDPFVQVPPANIWRYAKQPGGGEERAWQPVSPPCPMGEFEVTCVKLRAVWVESAARQWFAGDDGKIFRTDASEGGVQDPPARLAIVEMNSSSLRRINALWGFNGNDVWAVGGQGSIRHWVGGEAWEIVESPVTGDLYGVWGSRPDDVWAVGDGGAVLHWDGKAWAVKNVPFPVGKRPRFYAVAGTGDDVWIAGEGMLLRSTSATGGDR